MALTQQVSHWLTTFESALGAKDYACILSIFDDGGCFWRDIVTFTWNIKTLEGKEEIAAMLRARLEDVRPSAFRIAGEASLQNGAIEAFFTFETAVARGKGHLRLKGEKCWTLLTAIRELKGHEEARGAIRPMGTQHGVVPGRDTWLDRKRREEAELGHTRQPYCVIVGGGQGGVGLAARLKQLSVPTIVLERNERAGDTWRKRYKSLCLHDPVWYDHLPYMPFPEHWPVFSPKDKFADWLEMYVKVMELNYWTSSECKGCTWNEAAQEWAITVQRGSETIVLRPKQLILATGHASIPHVPHVPGVETFKGEVHHSSRHAGGEAYRGKRCVVVGSNNSAHDIAADLWEHGAADITMIQRSSSMVIRSETLASAFDPLYSESAVKNGITTDVADMIFASIPYRLLPFVQKQSTDAAQVTDAALYDALRKRGFMLDFGVDGSGLFMKYLRHGAGYYIDVGASQLIIDGSVKLKSPATVARVTEHSAVLADGTELPADVIVFATGFDNMNGWVAKLVSQEVADKIGPVWGLGSDTRNDPGPWQGELRNMWKPTAQPGLWIHGGNLGLSRFYSLALALQLKARMAGIATPVYGGPGSKP